jgi:NAD-dependent SIR2 family protein deacetylase
MSVADHRAVPYPFAARGTRSDATNSRPSNLTPAIALYPSGLAITEIHVITQNVDDLHERAGTLDAVHIHGRLLDSHRERCKTGYHVPAQESLSLRVAPPQCDCDG